MSKIAETYHRLCAEIARASDHPVEIVGVAKKQPKERLREAIEAGLRIVGNNYVQEGDELRREFEGKGIRWHFIGHIQSRKAKEILDYDLIESLDRIDIAADIDKRLEGKGRRLPVLVEVNVGNEAQKSGVVPEKLKGFLDALRGLRNLEVQGLMAMPPPLPIIEDRRVFFRNMKTYFDDFAKEFSFKHLSMGTSEDYRVAVSEGANLVRLGTALFGSREYADR